jgi:hypothetical protein
VNRSLIPGPRPRRPGRRPSRRWYRPLLEELETRLAPANVDVLSAHNDSSLSGQNLREEVLTPASVNATDFGKLFSEPVDGYVYAQPLYKANLNIGGAPHDVAFVATEHDSVYALDADSPTAGPNGNGLYWKTSFLDPANGVTSVPAGDVGIVSTNIVPEVGITGTPVIDPATNTLYVVAKTKEVRADGAHYVQKLHALDLGTGREKFNGPATIGDTTGSNNNTSPVSVPGGGDGAVNGVVTFNARKELQRPGLQLVGGVVYLSWASHEDDRPYHGWVVGYNAGDLAAGPVKVFNTAPNAGGVGVWESGGSLAADAQGNLYFAVGNGFNGPDPAYDPAHGDYSESVLKLSTTGQLTVADYFTPFDWATLDAQDADLGSGGTMLLPDYVASAAHPHLVLETGKSGKIYLIDRDDLGRFTAGGPDRVVQVVTAGQAGVWGNPSFLKVDATSGIIYYHGQGDVLKGYRITNGHIDDNPADILRSNIPSGYPGTQPVVSANGVANPDAPTNGIVWELQVDNYGSEGRANGQSILRAFGATNLATELYDSGQTSLRDQPGGAVKFTVPTVSNGHVLVAAQYTFSVFGLFPAATTTPAARTNLQGSAQANSQGAQILLTWTNPPPNPGAAATGIKILRSTDGTSFTPIATVAAQTATYTDAGPFVTGQHYFYRVVATNQVGDSAPSNTVDVVAPIPSAVLTITGVTSSALSLSWTRVANDHYDVERSTDGVSFTRVATVPGAQTTYTDTGLAPGIYAYRVHAYNVNPTSDSLSNVRGATVGGVIDHGTGFGNTADLTANGDAGFGDNIVRLTGADLQTGSFFANTPLTVARFSTTFVVRLSEGTQPNYADGFTFVLQANAPAALGQGLGGLGYQGISNSVAVKFGSFQYPGDPSSSSTGLVVNGAAPRGGVTTGSVLLNSQDPKRVDLTYDGTTLTETITDTLTNDSFSTSFVVDIPRVIGSDLAYAGFTASTGSPGAASFWQLQDVGSWTFTSQAPLPGAPGNLRVTDTGASEIDLAWDGHSYNETGFAVERSRDDLNFVQVATTTGTAYRDTGLGRGTYYYRVRAFNAGGASPYTNIVVATVPADDPAPVITGITRGNFAVKPDGTFTLDVTFSDPDPDDPHTALITWGDGSADTTVPLAAGVFHFTASHQYLGAQSGTNYSVGVTVEDDDGGSDTVDLTAGAASVAPPPGLTDWYTGDGYTPTTAADIAGTNPGTLVGGVTYVPGKVGNAFSFNGTDGYVKLPDNFIPYPTAGTRNAPFSFTAWFKTTAGGVLFGQQSGPAFGGAPSGYVPAVYVGTDGKLWAQMFWTGQVQQAASAAPVNDGQFHFVAVSSDGVTETVYLDDQLIGTISGVQVAYTSTYYYQIGTGYTGGGWNSVPGGWDPFRGLIDEVQIFNTTLAPAVIGAIYNAGGAGQVKGVTVRELPPAITSLSRSAYALNEGGTLALDATFTDPQPGDPHTAVITWGDGSADTTLTVAADAAGFSASHLYEDEPPGGGGYPIRVTVRDVAGGSDTVNLTAGAPAVTPPAGLVGWWTGDGNNLTTAPDIAGTNPGTLSGGVTYAPGEVGNAFAFDGGNASYVNIADAPALNVTTGATWDFWFKTTQAGTYVGLVGKHDATTSLHGVTVYVDPTGLPSVQIKSDQTVGIAGSTRVNDGRFHHLALTFQSGGAMLLYVDGQLQASATAPVFSFNPNPLRFGRLLDPFWAPLNGMLDEVQIFNRILSAGEIRALADAGSAGQVKGVTVLDPAVAATGGFRVTAVAGVASRPQTVATFTDPGGPEPLADYSAQVNWGDNSTSAGVISFDAGTGVFTVQGSHPYAEPGTYPLTVTVRHDAAPDATATGTAQVEALVLHLLVAGFPSPTVAGTPGDFTVTALDQLGEAVTGYTGTVHFSSSDPQAVLPGDYAFTAADAGMHAFRATLETAGTQSLTATDTQMPAVTGTQDGIEVDPAAASTLSVSGFPSPAQAGTGAYVLVQALDPYGNVASGYTGTVHLSSTDPQAYLDPDYTYTAADAGQHYFVVFLFTAGTRSLTAIDTATPSLTGTQSGILVTPADAAWFVVSNFTPDPVTAGQAGTFTVTAIDAFGNVATGYTGTVHFSSSDGQAMLPDDYPFTAGDNGRHTFTATLRTPGVQSLTATDPATGASGTQDNIDVLFPADPARSGAGAGLVATPGSVGGGPPAPVGASGVDPFPAAPRKGPATAATGYRGTAPVRGGPAVLPADHVFAGADHRDGFAALSDVPGGRWVDALDALMASLRGRPEALTA